MSFDSFVGGYHDGECAPFSLDIVENAFASAITNRAYPRDGSLIWTVEYEIEHPGVAPRTILIDGIEHTMMVRDSAEIYIGLDNSGPRLIKSLMVAGAVANVAFYASLLTILQATQTAFYWSGENSLVIGRAEIIEEIPKDMIKVLGPPFLVTRPEDIIDRIKLSG